ncbi:unnamed protein product [Lactuca saligna]|uniref:Remorin C-terminal domain-containing protein n=1 Tax=Lactuca saligna TaxID=75948 RepID=A0AA35V2A3_LACSI|nr:unnamed protein product [Lactuca saligna]
MEGLLKQISTIFFREKENEAQTTRVIRDRKISSRRTRSSKEDRRKGQNWHQRQPSRETSRDYDKMEGEEFRTAVAAAAFAVNSIENKEDEMKQDPGSNSRKSSEIQEVSQRPQSNEDLQGEANNHPTTTIIKMKPDNNVSKKSIGSTMSIDKTPSFSIEKQLDEETSKLDLEKRLGDVWEKTELQKIKERFTKVKAVISEWENKKKLRAKKKLIKKEGKLEWKRARELQDFMRKMQTIENISREAISQTEENRRNEEDRVKENANMIRSTGKIQKPIYLCCWF